VRSHRLQGTLNMALVVETHHRVHRPPVTTFLDGISFLTICVLGRSKQDTHVFSALPCASTTCNSAKRTTAALPTIAILR
jgi:hypothetical protein